jgi:hypothetical protein
MITFNTKQTNKKNRVWPKIKSTFKFNIIAFYIHVQNLDLGQNLIVKSIFKI